MTQRAAMKSLYQQLRGKKIQCVKQYATLEDSNIVKRKKNSQGLTSEEYARYLFQDGLSKGWL